VTLARGPQTCKLGQPFNTSACGPTPQRLFNKTSEGYLKPAAGNGPCAVQQQRSRCHKAAELLERVEVQLGDAYGTNLVHRSLRWPPSRPEHRCRNRSGAWLCLWACQGLAAAGHQVQMIVRDAPSAFERWKPQAARLILRSATDTASPHSAQGAVTPYFFSLSI